MARQASQDGQGDVDEEVSAATRDKEDAERRDWARGWSLVHVAGLSGVFEAH